MAWGGKIICGTIGACIGGPLGAVIGAAIGHGIDSSDGTGSIGSTGVQPQMVSAPSPSLMGKVAFSIEGTTFNLKVATITHVHGVRQSGKLRITMWATSSPYKGGNIHGYVVAQHLLSPLQPGYQYANLEIPTPYRDPPHGKYYMALTLDELRGADEDAWLIIDFCSFDNEFNLGNIPEPSPSPEDKLQTTFVACFFSCLAKMAKADGKVTQEEGAYVENLMRHWLGLPEEGRKFAVRVFNHAKDNDTDITAYLCQFADVFKDDHEIRSALLRALCELAMADKHLSDAERDVLFVAERILRLPPGSATVLVGNEMRIEDAYRVLGCTAKMSVDEIKKAYREKCKRFHPDILQSKGLPSEFVEFANKELAKINQAYDRICSSLSSGR